jgi:hypothetical protein
LLFDTFCIHILLKKGEISLSFVTSMKWLIFILSLLLLSVAACKKEQPIDNQLAETELPPVYAGEEDTSMFSYTFPNPVAITVNYDSMNLYGNGISTLDFDFDGVTDLTIAMDILNQDSLHLLNGLTPNPQPNCIIEGGANIAIAMTSETLQINGNLSTVYWCDTIQQGQKIGAHLEWSEVNTQLSMWKETGSGVAGCWIDADGINYIGFKFNEKYGWLAIDVTDSYNPLLIKFAIQR